MDFWQSPYLFHKHAYAHTYVHMLPDRGSVTQIYFMSNLDILYGLTVRSAVWFVRDMQINYKEEFNVMYQFENIK